MILLKDKLGRLFTEEAYCSDPELLISSVNLDSANNESFKIDYDDFVVSVPAYLTLAELDQTLLETGMVSFFNAPAQYSIGKILAENWCNDFPRQVLGLGLIDVNSQESKTGGKVIKNVSGYDLAKIFLGSYNSFAPINYAFLTVNKAFEREAKLSLKIPREKFSTYINSIFFNFLTQLQASFFDPALDLILDFNHDHISLDIKFSSSDELLKLRSDIIKNELNAFLPSSLSKETQSLTRPYEKKYLSSCPRILFHSRSDSLEKLFYDLLSIVEDLNQKMQEVNKLELKILPAKKRIELVSKLGLFDSILENLQKINQDFYINIFPVNYKNKIIERKFNASKLNAYELELMRGIKKVYDPKNLLNPGILMEHRN